MKRPLSIWFAACALTLSAPGIASKPEPLVLKPSSKWHVNYADDQCRLARKFGQGDHAVLLFMDRYAPGEYFLMTLSGKTIKSINARADAEVRFGPGEQEQEIPFFNGNLEKEPAFVFSSARIAQPSEAELLANKRRQEVDWTGIQPISEDRNNAVQYLRIGRPLRKPIMLETGSLRAPLIALNKCVDNLLKSWGLDAEKHKSLSQQAKPLTSPGKWVVSSDYPSDMLMADQPALVNFRLNIGANGVPVSCYIQATTRPKEFDKAVCKSVMKRARFSPALDAQGQPMATYYQSTVRFQIP